MDAYYIWSYQSTSSIAPIIKFIITNGSMTGRVDEGKAFYEGVLHDLGVERQVKEWTTTPVRSIYFSEYIGEDDWRDNWQIVWKCHAVLEGDESVKFATHDLFVGTDAYADNWQGMPKDDDPVPCIVIADFETEVELQDALDTIEATDFSQMRSKYGAGNPVFNRFRVLDRFIQIQIDLGVFPLEFYRDDAQYALHIIKICEEAGGIVNHLEHGEEDEEDDE